MGLALNWVDHVDCSGASSKGLVLRADHRAGGLWEAQCFSETDDRTLGGVLCETREQAKREAEGMFKTLSKVGPVEIWF